MAQCRRAYTLSQEGGSGGGGQPAVMQAVATRQQHLAVLAIPEEAPAKEVGVMPREAATPVALAILEVATLL